MFRGIIPVTVIAFLFLALSSPALAEKRIALVIGNGTYPNVGDLANPPNDAKLMASTLRELGFEVIEEIDVNQKAMKKAIKKFGDRLVDAGKDTVGLFFYAGHGVQVNGQNYIIPVNVEINDEADVDIESVSMSAVLQNMAFAGNNMNIIIMDACRNNPFKRSFRAASRGLARMDAAKGTLIAYATAPGDVAADGSGLNSPYTLALTTNMVKPGLTVERMFKGVRNDVVESTNSAQVPWESSSLTGGDFYFSSSPTGAITSTQSTAQSNEVLFWKSVQNSLNTSDYEAYLNQYPKGIFAALAKVKINQLNSVISTTPTAETTIVALTNDTYFKSGDYKPEILKATGQCISVKLSKMTASRKEINGRWRHPETRGTISLNMENEMISVRWKGKYIKSNRELVQLSGTSLLVDLLLKHNQGSCKISFKLTNILAN